MTLRNDVALFPWGFVAVWWAMLLAFTWIVWRDGPPPGMAPPLSYAVLGVFWLFGLGAARWAFARRRTAVEVGPDGSVTLRQTTPLRRRRETLARRDIAGVEVEQGKDSEGDPYFTAWLVLRDRRRVAVKEGHVGQAVENDARRLRQALGLSLPRRTRRIPRPAARVRPCPTPTAISSPSRASSRPISRNSSTSRRATRC